MSSSNPLRNLIIAASVSGGFVISACGVTKTKTEVRTDSTSLVKRDSVDVRKKDSVVKSSESWWKETIISGGPYFPQGPIATPFGLPTWNPDPLIIRTHDTVNQNHYIPYTIIREGGTKEQSLDLHTSDSLVRRAIDSTKTSMSSATSTVVRTGFRIRHILLGVLAGLILGWLVKWFLGRYRFSIVRR